MKMLETDPAQRYFCIHSVSIGNCHIQEYDGRAKDMAKLERIAPDAQVHHTPSLHVAQSYL